ncbi:LLM class F420-dependent oxidoreductase [Rugosimonospora acidiphila]|uniref:LLM class F420-dependent oxidoreductase n=1 Tax=Rugosimonospora acidiphila TaxID=556531 RepID=A0ABP9SH94_9ACTN
MKLGLHVSDFTWPGGPPALAPTLVRIARDAEDAGFGRLSVMDHFWQIEHIGPPEHEMLEAYTTLGFLAAHTRTLTLHTLVTGVTYRQPGLLAKAVSTLDVLSGGRAMLGIGAAWNGDESAGLGFAFPPTAERFERLEETLQIILQMWSDDEGLYQGKHYQLGRTLNSPQPLSSPRPKILIGGTGERKTLRLVAQYADSCNLFSSTDLAHKLDVLREHCANLGRDYDTIEKTVMVPFELGKKGEGADKLLAQLREVHELGFTVATGSLRGPDGPELVAAYGEHIIPEIANW